MDSQRNTKRNIEPSRPARSLFSLLAGMVRKPQQILVLWNWKSALLSIILRGPIFLAAAARRGLMAALAALVTESVFCTVTAGFYGAIIQSLKDAEPEWLTGIILVGVIPMIFQGLEYLLHWFRETPHLRVAAIVSLIVSAISALFNWYAMRRGTLLVGTEGRSLGADLSRLPRLIFGFVAILPRKIFDRRKKNSSRLLHEI